MGALSALRTAAAAAVDLVKSGKVVTQAGKTAAQEAEEVGKGFADVELGIKGTQAETDAAVDLGISVGPDSDVAGELAAQAKNIAGVDLLGDTAKAELTALQDAGIILPSNVETDTETLIDSALNTADAALTDGVKLDDPAILENLGQGVPLSTTPPLQRGPGFLLDTNPIKLGTGPAKASDHGTLVTSLDAHNNLVYTVMVKEPKIAGQPATYTAVSSSELPDFITSGTDAGKWKFNGPSSQVSGLSGDFYSAATNAPSVLRWMYLKLKDTVTSLADPKNLIILPGGAIATVLGVKHALAQAGLGDQDPNTITNDQWLTIYNALAKQTNTAPAGPAR